MFSEIYCIHLFISTISSFPLYNHMRTSETERMNVCERDGEYILNDTPHPHPLQSTHPSTALFMHIYVRLVSTVLRFCSTFYVIYIAIRLWKLFQYSVYHCIPIGVCIIFLFVPSSLMTFCTFFKSSSLSALFAMRVKYRKGTRERKRQKKTTKQHDEQQQQQPTRLTSTDMKIRERKGKKATEKQKHTSTQAKIQYNLYTDKISKRNLPIHPILPCTVHGNSTNGNSSAIPLTNP